MDAVRRRNAWRGAVILREGGCLKGRQIADSSFATAVNEPLENSLHASSAIVNFVVRSSSELVLDDAHSDERFSLSRYVRANRLRPLVCFRIGQQGQPIGACYRERHEGAEWGAVVAALRGLCAHVSRSRPFGQARKRTLIETTSGQLHAPPPKRRAHQPIQRARTPHAPCPAAAAITNASFYRVRFVGAATSHQQHVADADRPTYTTPLYLFRLLEKQKVPPSAGTGVMAIVLGALVGPPSPASPGAAPHSHPVPAVSTWLLPCPPWLGGVVAPSTGTATDRLYHHTSTPLRPSAGTHAA